jgi:D-beta-D-heptose 7-phosphate kinase/D-beta-D-heptose 1-phosphate adenosyltransferase
LTPTLIQAVIQEAKEREIPVITDPKGKDFAKYVGTTLIKPNLSEAYAAAGLSSEKPLEMVAEKLLALTQSELIMITRSEEGITFFEANGCRHDFSVQAKEVKDVTGAGDTVLAMLAFSLANRLSFKEAAELCNIAASLAIEHLGCAQISLKDVVQHVLKHKKIFGQDDHALLGNTLAQFNLLIISKMQPLCTLLYQAIKALGAQQPLALIITDPSASPSSVEMLASLSEVQYVMTLSDPSQMLGQLGNSIQAFIFQNEKLQLLEEQNEYQCPL